jgi:hypothetical protein
MGYYPWRTIVGCATGKRCLIDFFAAKSKTAENSIFPFELEDSKKVTNGRRRLNPYVTFHIDAFFV